MGTDFFELRKHQSSAVREILAGLTTFLTMAYIIVLQPNILAKDFSGQATGMDPGGVLIATCLSAAVATALMGLYGRLPVALAPGMGQNFFFVTVIMAMGSVSSAPWQAALAIVLVAGVAFLLLTVLGLRAAVLSVMSPSMRNAISVGIGLFIAFLGLKNGAQVVDAPSLVALNASNLLGIDSQVFWAGLAVTLLLGALRVPGNLLLGIVAAAAVAYSTGKIQVQQWWGLPEVQQSMVWQFDFAAAFTTTGLTFVAVFLFMDIFDTTGTLIGVTEQAGLADKHGQVPRMRQAMLADAVGTVVGAILGTSTVTSFIESAAGVQQGGRTGLTALTVAVLFVLAIGLSPLLLAVGAYLPITAPALVVVGGMMFGNVQRIDWDDQTESLPAFLVILGIPLFSSIADGIALGLIVWPWLKLMSGRVTEVPLTSWILTAVLVAYFVLIRTQI